MDPIPDWDFDGMTMNRHSVFSTRADLIELRDEAIEQSELGWSFKLSIAIMMLHRFGEMMAPVETILICPECGNRESVDWDPPFALPPCSAECSGEGNDNPRMVPEGIPQSHGPIQRPEENGSA